MTDTVFDREAVALRSFIGTIRHAARTGERAMAERAAAGLADYERRLERARVAPTAIRPARLALAVQIDHAARSVPRVRTSTWLAAAHVHIFDRNDVTVDTIRRFRDTATDYGAEYADLEIFLSGVLSDMETLRRTREGVSRKPAYYIALATLLLVLSLSAYALLLDYRYHSDIRGAFNDGLTSLPSNSVEDRLAMLAASASQVSRASQVAPLSRVLSIDYWASGPFATSIYQSEVDALLPAAIRNEIGETLATEGGDLALYDALRAWSVLTGETDWTPGYVVGWLEKRGKPELARHVEMLSGPVPGLSVPDQDYYDQALGFAAAAPEADRAYLELSRQSAVRALPDWSPEAAGVWIEDVLILRSGQEISEGIPGLYSEVGWAYARNMGRELAVQTAREQAHRIFGAPLETRSDTSDVVMDRLQSETLRTWQAWLEDLRVQPFVDQQDALRISSALAQRSSPLETLFRSAWREVGGEDLERPHEAQLAVAEALGDAIAYLDAGRLPEISRLFGALNVALGSIEIDDERGADRLMSIQERARTITALEGAPPLISQITEDVLAQTSAAHASILTNPLVRQWQQQVFPLCQSVIGGNYPFGEGDDADAESFARLFGPQGALAGFVNGHAREYLDTSGDVWRWLPEARVSGVTQDSAQFLQRALVLSGAFFNTDGSFGQSFEIAALAERGAASISLGGTETSLRVSDAETRLTWPGASPASGAEIAIHRDASFERVTEAGTWGLLRLLEQTTVRNREGGRRHLVDLKTGNGRLFFEITFENELNPISARPLAQGLSCPPVL